MKVTYRMNIEKMTEPQDPAFRGWGKGSGRRKRRRKGREMWICRSQRQRGATALRREWSAMSEAAERSGDGPDPSENEQCAWLQRGPR